MTFAKMYVQIVLSFRERKYLQTQDQYDTLQYKINRSDKNETRHISYIYLYLTTNTYRRDTSSIQNNNIDTNEDNTAQIIDFFYKNINNVINKRLTILYYIIIISISRNR